MGYRVTYWSMYIWDVYLRRTVHANAKHRYNIMHAHCWAIFHVEFCIVLYGTWSHYSTEYGRRCDHHSSSLGRSTVTCGYYQYVLESKVQFSRLFVNGGGLNADDVYSSTLELPHCTASGDSTRKGFRGTCRRREGIEILRAIDSCRSTYYIPFDSPTRSERGERRRGEAEHI